MNESKQMQREHLFNLLGQLTKQIRELQKWLRQKVADNWQVQLLLTRARGWLPNSFSHGPYLGGCLSF